MESLSYSSKDVSVSAIKYYLHQYWIDECDPRTKHYFVMKGGPEMLFIVMGSWLLFVTKIGPNLMKNRKPFELRKAMFVYNIFMVLSNAYFFVLSIKWLNYGKRLFEFEFPSRDDISSETLKMIDEVEKFGYTKLIDLLDTIFFVLRKKDSQITFLHLYHHFMVPVLAWISLKVAPTIPPIGVFAVLNTLIHVIMYSYYALAAFGPKIQKFLWWKKYITIAQLIQFILFITYGLFSGILSSGYPSALYWIGQAQSPIFLYLFWNFYKHSYRYNNRKTQKVK